VLTANDCLGFSGKAGILRSVSDERELVNKTVRERPASDIPKAARAGGVTIRDVAREAGVSIATVSHVLNNTRPVSEELRERVLASASRLNFHPSPSARRLRIGQGPLVELVTASLGGSLGRIALSAALETQRRGARLAISVSTDSDFLIPRLDSDQWTAAADADRKWPTQPADAAVHLSPRHPGASGGATTRGGGSWQGGDTPAAGWQPTAAEPVNLVIDLEAAGRLAASLLIRSSRVRLGLVWCAQPASIFSASVLAPYVERGMQEALRAAGLGGGQLIFAPADDPSIAFAGPASRRPSGFIVNSGAAALRLAIAARSAGLRVPGDAAIISLDRGADCPGLDAITAVEWPWDEAGAWLARRALDRALNLEIGAPAPALPFNIVRAATT
jgi:LacI family transcriptional regulator